MTTANIALAAEEKPYRNSPQPAERPKKTPLAKAASSVDALTDIDIRPMVWDGYVQQTGSADMDFAL